MSWPIDEGPAAPGDASPPPHGPDTALRKVYVELTGRCNLQCPMCPRTLWSSSVDHMPGPVWDALLAGLPVRAHDPVTLTFGGFGEPTLHPHWLDCVDQARAAGHRVEIITNGTTVTPAVARTVAALGVAQVTVSIDGGDAESYAAVRGRQLAPVLEATAALCAARRAAPAMQVGIACVASRRNAASLPSLLDLATELDVDFVSISNVVPHTREVAADVLWAHAAQTATTPPARTRPRVVVGRIDLIEETWPLVDRLLRRVRVVPPPALDAGIWHNRCRFVLEGMAAVTWDGRIAPCLSLLYTHAEFLGHRERLVRHYHLGEVRSAPLATIWEGNEWRAFRRRVREFDFSPCLSCGGCELSRTNDTDCFGSPFPSCSGCLWAQGIVICP